MLASTFKGVPYAFNPVASRDPLFSAGILLKLPDDCQIGAPAVADQKHLQLNIDDGHCFISFHCLRDDKETLDQSLKSISQFLRPKEKAKPSTDLLIGDPLHVFHELIYYHTGRNAATNRFARSAQKISLDKGGLLPLPPMVEALTPEQFAACMAKTQVALVAFNGSEERCRYIVNRLFGDMTINQTPITRRRPAANRSLRYGWSRCNQAYKAELWPCTNLLLKPDGVISDPRDPHGAVIPFVELLLGGGYAFSSGGPGKGLLSRYHTRVLPIPGVSIAAACRPKDYIGYEVAVEAEKMLATTQLACRRELYSIADKGPTKEELHRVKNQLAFQIASMDHEEQLRHYAHQLIATKQIEIGLDEILEGINALTKKHITKGLTQVLDAEGSLEISMRRQCE